MDVAAKKVRLARLVRRFEQHKAWDESQTKKSLIEPFWELLGWNIRDPDEVVLEKRVEMDAHLRRADYAFALDGRISFLVEAKPPKRNLTKDREAIFQLKRYVFNTPGVWVGILTDFEEFVPFLVVKKPDYKNPAEGMLKQLVMKYTDYSDRWDELEATFSKEAVAAGALEKLLPRTKKLEVVAEPVDKAFFNDIMEWRLDIARSIARNNPDVTSEKLNEAVNDLLNRILFIRIVEDRDIEPYTILYDEWRKWQREQRGALWAYLLELFAKLNPKYNGALFRKAEDDPLSNLIIDDKPLHNLIKNLYYPDSPYQFSALPVEIIGNAYERYLGSVLRITPARRVKLEEKPEVRKAGGVYYTPKYIVDYIVEQTLGRLLKGKKPKDVRKIKVLDPACGSGSFLIGAYERIMKYYIDYYSAHPSENKGYVIETRNGEKKLSLKLKKQILMDNIYGVDIDQRAVDMAQFSLYVKMMEGEEFRSLFGEGVLPDLRDNIVCGNSLVSWDIVDMGILPDEVDERTQILRRLNPMDWEERFGDIMRSGGFDVVIGNPPYIFGELIYNIIKPYFKNKFELAKRQYDYFWLFIEKSMKLVKKQGGISLIVPDSLLARKETKLVRNYILKSGSLLCIFHAGKCFDKAGISAVVFTWFNYNKVRKVNVFDLKSKNKFEVIRKLDTNIIEEDYLKRFLIYIDSSKMKIIKKLKNNILFDDYIKRISRGEEYGKKALIFTPSSDFKRILIGKNIGRYIIRPKPKYFIDKNLIKKNLINYISPKIVLVKTGKYISSTIETNNVITLQSVYNIHLVNEELIYSILGILNSKLMNFWIKCTVTFYKKLFPQITQETIRKIPFPELTRNSKLIDNLTSFVRTMLELHKKLAETKDERTRKVINRQIEITDRKIDRIVYELYGLSEEEIRIVERKEAK